jgi:antitoxin component YwqK of YwqJK toxin-antitoxin module
MAVKKIPSIPSGDINKTDAKGKKNGMWLITQPARMGEPSSTEFGSYEHGNKTGLWYKLGGEGDLLAVETFKNNVLDGEAKYYENGRINCVGYYRGLNPNHDFDTVFVLDPATHHEITRIIPTERGSVRHGTWRFYDTDNGRMVREEDYQVDELVFSKDYPYSKADSAAILKRETKLPHNKDNAYKPPINKQVSYTEAKQNG